MLEDFEWDLEPYSRKTGVDRHPSNHYETAETAHTPEEIVERCLDRFACAADDCILFKWVTIPHLAIALDVMRLQGFTYRTHLVWHKLRAGAARGLGHWATGEHEVLLIGARGNIVAPYPAHFRSLFEAPVGKHSVKPDKVYEIIEFHWPNTPKIELNARRRRPGWEAWGNEVDQPPNDNPSPIAQVAAPVDAGLDIPSFLRRGHPDCHMTAQSG